MKFLRILFYFVFFLLLVFVGLYISGNSHLVKAVTSTYLVGKTGPTIDDYRKFENRVVKTNQEVVIEKAKNFNQYKLEGELLEEVKSWETVALVILKDGKLLYENYWDGYSSKSKTNTFSMAKSFISLCIGAAIKEGKIKSVNQTVGDFIPAYNEGKKASITIKDLLTMSSGVDFGESYGDPFGFMAKTYYGNNLYDLTLEKEVKDSPGKIWKYQGGNTLLLSFILKKATGKSVSEYFSEKFWQPLGASQDALWTISDDGNEKSYCCFYSNAQDFTRIGQLMLDSGMWQGKQLISRDYFNESITPINLLDAGGKTVSHYGYQWWLGEYNSTTFYYARGILGQYIVSIPSWNMVVVRLGHKRDPQRGARIPKDLFSYLDVAHELLMQVN